MSIETLKCNGQTAESTSENAEMLNNQFCSAFTREDTNNVPSKRHPPHPSMPKIHTTQTGVVNCIKS